MSPRNTDEGNSSANSSVKLHSPRSMNVSMKPFTRRVMSSSCSSMRFGANSGSSNFRYLECCGGSTFSGMSGRTFPRLISTRDENSSAWRSRYSVLARLKLNPRPSMAST